MTSEQPVATMNPCDSCKMTKLKRETDALRAAGTVTVDYSDFCEGDMMKCPVNPECLSCPIFGVKCVANSPTCKHGNSLLNGRIRE